MLTKNADVAKSQTKPQPVIVSGTYKKSGGHSCGLSPKETNANAEAVNFWCKECILLIELKTPRNMFPR